MFGSYALKVLSKAEVPTLVVQNKKFTGYKNVLFPINTFTEARQKVGIATRVAHRFNSTIHIFKEKVADPVEMSRIEIISKQIVDEFKREKVDYTLHNAEKSGDSARQLIDFAAANNMDMIMVLTEPQIGTTYFNLGPWNEKIMFNDAQIPVLCINPVEHSQIYFSLKRTGTRVLVHAKQIKKTQRPQRIHKCQTLRPYRAKIKKQFLLF